ncbi:AAA family ATPase [Corynebacterium pyruviciproducens]
MEPSTWTYTEELAGAVRLSDLKPVTRKDVWLIPNLVCRTLNSLYGVSGAGKSVLACELIRCVLTGEKFLGVKPLNTVDSVLILCSDAGAELEYRDRLGKLKVDLSKVCVVPGVGVEDTDQWFLYGALAGEISAGLVIIDHATGMLDGDPNDREPWRELYQDKIGRFLCPVVLLAHSSDWGGSNKSHRIAGNSAAKQFTRCQMEIDQIGNPRKPDSVTRRVTVDSNYSEPLVKLFDLVNGRVKNIQDNEKTPKRGAKTLDQNAEIVRLAKSSSKKTKKEVAGEVASFMGISSNTLYRRTLKDLERKSLLVPSSRSQETGYYES